MANTFRIQMMDHFAIYINEEISDQLVTKSKKGSTLIQFLIMHSGKPVPNKSILTSLWNEEKSTNPENALKTMVSRLRVTMNQIDPALGDCIVSDRGSYHWECMPGMTVDMYELEDLFEKLKRQDLPDAERRSLYQRMLALYQGDLLQHSGQNAWALAKATTLHNKYISAIYSFIDMLKEEKRYPEIISLCRKALDVDSFDDRIHMELMSALIHINRTGEALVQYKHVVQLNYRYLGVQPSEDLQEFYKQIVSAGRTLDFNLAAICKELRDSAESRGAFVCDYTVFKEIYHLQMRNLERLGATMFLAIIMITPYNDAEIDTMRLDNIMTGLLDILQLNLRKGDTITRFTPSIYALLLPTVNYSTGGMVLERIKRSFYRVYPNSNITFNYRVGPLSAQGLPEDDDMLKPRE